MGNEHCVDTESKPILMDNNIYISTNDNIKVVSLSSNRIEDFTFFDSLKHDATSKGMLEKYLHETGYYRFATHLGKYNDILLISCGAQGQYYIWGISKENLAFEVTIDKNQLNIKGSNKVYAIDNNVKDIILPIYENKQKYK